MDSSLRRSRLSRYSEKWPIILGCYTGLIVIGLMFNLLIGEMYKVERPHVTKNGTEYTVNAVLNDPNGLIMVQVEAVNSEIRMRYVGFGYDSAVKPIGFDFAEKLVIKDKAVILHSYFDSMKPNSDTLQIAIKLETSNDFNVSLISSSWHFAKFDYTMRMAQMGSVFLVPSTYSTFHLTLMLQIFTSVPLSLFSRLYGFFQLAILLEKILLCFYITSYLNLLMNLISTEKLYTIPICLVTTCLIAFGFLVDFHMIDNSYVLLSILTSCFCLCFIIYSIRILFIFYLKLKTSDQSDLYCYLFHIYSLLFIVSTVILFLSGHNLISDFYMAKLNLAPTLRLISSITLILLQVLLTPIDPQPREIELETSLIS